MRLSIQNGRIIDPASDLDRLGSVFIANGQIVSLDDAPAGFQADQTIDAGGLVVCPGLIDLSARLREPGFEYKATLESEMLAAITGGITSLVCPPDTDPPLDEPGLVEMLKFRARSLNQARVYPLGALTVGLAGRKLTEMAELFDAGCIGFSHANAPLSDTMIMLRAMQYAATFGFTVWLRAEDAFLAADGVAHDGEVATRLGLQSIPVCAETVALSTILALAEKTGARVHICRLSSADAVNMLRRARHAGIAVTADVSLQHVHLCEVDIGYFDSNCHLIPPLRAAADRDALRAGLLDGTIDAICSDHTPVDDDAKLLPFAESEAGATGLELLLPLTLKWAEETKLPLAAALRRITTEPARVLGLETARLATQMPADLCIFDAEQPWRVGADALHSQGKNTPFTGCELRGRVRYTVVNGEVVFRASETQPPP